ncbi:MAG: hypothetical protein B6I35_11025 [Anaerolineaceae bacterium 4572_32.2]|nr:MAG: hypothetical protein B6I35_11025 [Anaerolineaceae bacterium 4572_32.2]
MSKEAFSMKCPECDIPLKGDELVCPNCLARLPARPSDEGPESLPAYTVSPDQPKPGIDVFLRRVPWRRLLLIGSLIAALFVAYMMWETFFHVRPEDYLDRGDDLYDQGHFESALAAYQRASEADPDMAAAYERAGWCYYQLQFDDAAVAQFRQAIAQEPDFAEAHLGLGQSLYYQRRYEEAEEALRRAIELAPGQAAGHAYLGSVYFLQQRYSDARPPKPPGNCWPQSLIIRAITFIWAKVYTIRATCRKRRVNSTRRCCGCRPRA